MPEVTRRELIRILPSSALAALGVAGAGTVAVGSGGCAALVGEETIHAYVVVSNGGTGTFWGWTEYHLDSPASPDDKAVLKRVLLRAPDGTNDLTFITSLLAEAVTPEARISVAEGSDFPKDDTMAPLDVLYTDNLRPLFPDGKTIRIEWSGTIDTTYVFPPEGIQVDALIVIEVL